MMMAVLMAVFTADDASEDVAEVIIERTVLGRGVCEIHLTFSQFLMQGSQVIRSRSINLLSPP